MDFRIADTFTGSLAPLTVQEQTAEIGAEAWESLNSLNSDASRPFAKPASGRIAVKLINHLEDEVMNVFGVE